MPSSAAEVYSSKTWGEQIVGNFGIGTVFGLISFGIIFLIGMPLFMIGASADSPALIIGAVIVVVLAADGGGSDLARR